MVFQPSMSRTYVGFQGGVIESCILEFNVSPFKIPRSELIYPIFVHSGSSKWALGLVVWAHASRKPRFLIEKSSVDVSNLGGKQSAGGGAKKEPTELILQHPYPLCPSFTKGKDQFFSHILRLLLGDAFCFHLSNFQMFHEFLDIPRSWTSIFLQIFSPGYQLSLPP